MNPLVASFHDPATSTFTHVAYDREGGHAAVVDPVLDFDPTTARTRTTSADRVLDFVQAHRLTVLWVLETHVHADHLTAASYLRERSGAKVAIGRGIGRVQERFKAFFDLEPGFRTDGSQFDRLFEDGEEFAIGDLTARTLGTPGHTDDSLTYLIGDAAFVGDTLFAPETGTGRTDFPGGSAALLRDSIARIFALPAATRIFLCHDYPANARAPQPWFALEEQRRANVHVGEATMHPDFVAMRIARDATLPAPGLILPALQVNIRAGELPPPDENGVRWLRLPLNRFGV